MASPIVRTDAQWVDVLETAYATTSDHQTWARDVVSASRRIFDGRCVLGALAIDHSRGMVPLFSEGAFELGATSGHMATLEAAGEQFMRAFFYPPTLVTTHTQLEPRLTPDLRAMLEGVRGMWGVGDALGMVVHPAPDVAAVVFAGSADKIELSRHAARRLTQVALHVEAGLRLRLRPESVKAVIEPNGKIAHLEPGIARPAVLAERARSIDAARTRKRRRDPESLELWTALVEGQMSLVERASGSKRHYLVIENAPARQPIRALNRAELDVVSEAARGLSSKLIAYGLGVSAPTVSARLASAASKLGLASRVELVRIAAMLCRDPRASLPDAQLTKAEREVLELLVAGMTNEEIAKARNRSARTIANQVANLLQKTGSPSRRVLATRA